MTIPTHWRGFWEQPALGRQPMHDVVLRFSDEAIEGGGHDIVGRFTFAGQIGAGGAVTMIKQYIGRHEVLYQGQYDGEGTIHGRWSIGPHESGPFVLHLAREGMNEDKIEISEDLAL